VATMIGCLPMQALAFLTLFVYATHATQAIAFECKPGFSQNHHCRGQNRHQRRLSEPGGSTNV